MRELFRVGLILFAAIVLPFCLVDASTEAWAQAVVQPTPGAVAATTVTTTGPVTSDTTISIGTLAGEALKWTLTMFAIPIAGLIVGVLYRLMTGIGFSLSESYRARFQELIVNGLNALATSTAGALHGKGGVKIGSPFAKQLVAYVQEHGKAVISGLAVQPNSQSFEEAVVARANRALNDPRVPTPPAITPAGGLPKAA